MLSAWLEDDEDDDDEDIFQIYITVRIIICWLQMGFYNFLFL